MIGDNGFDNDQIKTQNEPHDKFYDYPDRPVPAGVRRSKLNITVVTTGMAVAMSTLYTGSALASVLSYKDAVLSILIGCTVLGLVAVLTGSIGAKAGVSTSMLARHSFGRKGSNIVGLIFAVSMLGWFSYQCGYFGETIHILMPGHILTNPLAATFWGGMLMMSTAIVGYKGMTYLSMAAAPLLLGMCFFCSFEAISQKGLRAVMDAAPASPASLGVGITIVIGGWITGAVLQPDIARYARTVKDNTLGVIFAMIVFAVANWGGLVIAKATGASTIMDGMTILGLGGFAMMIVILGQWTSNDNNLYSAALAIINIKPKANKHIVSAGCGIIFTLLAILGIQKYFVDFLTVLGTFLPPFGTVIVADYYLLKRRNVYLFDGTEAYRRLNPVAFISVAIGGGAAFVLNFGSTAINSIIITLALYILLSKVAAENWKDHG